jgi:hypothetical protein
MLQTSNQALEWHAATPGIFARSWENLSKAPDGRKDRYPALPTAYL